MAQDKKKRIKVTYSLTQEVSDMIDDYNAKSFIPKTKIVEESVKEYIKKNSRSK